MSCNPAGWKSSATSTFAAASSPSFARGSARARRANDMPNDELNHRSHASHAVIAAAFLVVSATLGCTSPSLGAGGPASPSRSRAIAPGLSAITEADLRRDMFAMASDAMRGREAGTLDEMRATGWVAEQARAAGLQPAGDDGTFFQWWPMRRTRLSENSQITIADH